jgi:hypothetical protein
MSEATPLIPLPYEPPRIERVLTPEDLRREVQFAGKLVTLHEHPG